VKYEIPQDDLEYGDPVGKGASGIVYQGKWKDIEVALKKCGGVDPDRSEANIMRQLGQHPYVTALFGFCYADFCTTIVMQFAKYGSLYEYLHKKGEKPSLQQSVTWAKQKGLNDLLQLMSAAEQRKGKVSVPYSLTFTHAYSTRHIELTLPLPPGESFRDQACEV